MAIKPLPGQPLLFTPQQVAEHLSISRSKVYEMLATHELLAVRVGRALRVSSDELVALIERRSAGAAYHRPYHWRESA